MGLLNRPSDGLPSVGVAIAKFLAARGHRAAQDVLQLCDPKGLNSDDESMVGKTLNRWVQLGVFSEQEGVISLTAVEGDRPLFSKSDPLHEALRWHVLKCVMKSVSTPIEEAPAGDLVIASWWLLQLNPCQVWLNSDKAAIHRARQDFPQRKVIQNDTRWQGLIDWTTFLGLASTLGGGLIPNPTAAVRWALGESTFEQGVEVPAIDFVSNLVAEIPLLGDGHAASEAAAYFGEVPLSYRQSHQVPAALSLALLGLEAAGTLRFEAHQDTQSVILLEEAGGNHRRVETITLLAK